VRFSSISSGLFRIVFEDLFLEGVDEVVAFFFRMLLGVYRVVESVTVLFLEVLVKYLRRRGVRTTNFLGLELRVKFLDGGYDFLDLRVAELESVRDGFFGDSRAPDSTMTMASSVPAIMIFIKLFFWSATVGLITSWPSSNPTRDASDGLLKRQVRAISGGRSAGYGNDIGVVLAVRGEH